MPTIPQRAMTGFLTLALFLGGHFNCAVWAIDAEGEAQNHALRSEFLKEVEAASNLVEQKAHWFRVFSELKRSADKARKLADDFESRIAQAETNHEQHTVKFLQRKKNQLNEFAASDEVLQHLAVRQFALIQRLEHLEQSVKTRGASTEYVQQGRAILDEIAEVERLRQFEYLSQQLQNGFDTLADELDDLKATIRVSAPLFP